MRAVLVGRPLRPGAGRGKIAPLFGSMRSRARETFRGTKSFARALGLAAGLLAPALHGADDHVGVCAHFDQGWDPARLMPLIADAGAGWIRDGVPWADVEPARHRYVIPARLTAWLDAARARHLHVLLLLGYGNKIYADPFSPPDYAAAAAFLATRLAGRIDALEVLNEPNNPDFGPTYGGKWNGKEDDGSVSPYVRAYAKVLAATVAAVKTANPRMKVVGYGAPAPATFRMMALGVPPRLDGITDHPYSGGAKLPELIPYAATPDLLQRDGIATADAQGTYRSQCGMFRAQAAKFGLPNAPLWNTEWGYSTAVTATPDEKVVTPEAQAVYILRRLLEARALGVQTFYYVFRDDGGDPAQEWQNFGLVDINLKPKPAFFAFQRFTRMFAKLEGDGTADGFELHGVAPAETRCYAYHRNGSADKWIACWRVAPAPSSVPGATSAPPWELRPPAGTHWNRLSALSLADGTPVHLTSSPGPGGGLLLPAGAREPVVVRFVP
jgi:hypothetical protein